MPERILLAPPEQVAGYDELKWIDVWPVWLNAAEPVRIHFRDLLSAGEAGRADRYVDVAARRTFEVSRGVLRRLLSRYVGDEPQALELTEGPRGKPVLRRTGSIRFNLSHSHDLALYAIADGVEVGVDLEKVRPLADLDAVTRRFFHPQETAELMSLDTRQVEAFFRCWTRKEAYVKAIGDGLAAGFDRFQVSLLPGQAARMAHIEQNAGAAELWNLHHLEPAADYVGALAYAGTQCAVRVYAPAAAGELLRDDFTLRERGDLFAQ
ncbi:MAG: 4'-phosphopantetheinyl transferase superfamily protein [Bryobacteraceae bacterium]